MGKIEYADLRVLIDYIDAFEYERAIELAHTMGLTKTEAALMREYADYKWAGSQQVLFRSES